MKVLNVDLSQELSKDQLKILQTAFTEHLVLVFRQVRFPFKDPPTKKNLSPKSQFF